MSVSMIRNENDVDIKIVPLILGKLGYKEKEWTSQYRIKAGRTTIKPDFLVSSNLDDVEHAVNLILDSKNNNEVLDNYVDQVVSYGRLVKAKYSALLNEKRILVVENETYKISYDGSLDNLPSFLKRSEYFKKENRVTYTAKQITDALDSLMTFEDLKDFNAKFAKCQDIIRNNDGLTGSDAFDELSKILFVKMYLEDKSEEDPNKAGIFTVAKMEELGTDIISTYYFDEVKKTFPDIFDKNDTIKLKSETIKSIVEILEPYNLQKTDVDVKGKAYEILLGKTFTGSLGQHFTPRTVVNFMTSILKPSSRMTDTYYPKIIDPACGTGGFLIKCLTDLLRTAKSLNFNDDQISKIQKETIWGNDLNPRSARVSKMNMRLHGDGKGGIFNCDGLIGNQKLNSNEYDYVITNPPFGVKIKDEKILNKYTLKPNKIPNEGLNGEILFIERCVNLLKDEGKLGILIPDGLINNKTTEYVRNYIEENTEIDAIISLPDKTFKSANANAVTSIMFATKHKTRQNRYVFMALAEEIGFERTTKLAKPIVQNDLYAIEKRYFDYVSNIGVYNSRDDDLIQLSENPKCFLVKYEYLKSKRIDATYYYSTFLYPKEIGECVPLKTYASLQKRTLKKIDGEIKYIETSSVVPFLGLISETLVITNENRPNRAKMLVKEKDIICAKMRDTETNIAIIPPLYDNTLATNGFIVLTPKPPMTVECLYYLLKAETNLKQVRWKSSGTIMPTIDEEEYLKNWIPKLDKTQIDGITEKIRPMLDKMFDVIDEVAIFMGKKLY